MKTMLVITMGLALAVTSQAQSRKTIYVDRMEGLESFVESALEAAELPFDFVEEAKQPEMKATLAKMHAAFGEIIYRHKLGRNETHRLELLDVERNKVIAWHAFPLNGDDAARRKAAAEFAAKVKAAWAKRSK
ncbi:MAG: hypothetical protein NTZ56_11575 [Acidobacteria bacterium]|nr:hypothetical protein [Acidobacteriota bacterium]